MARYVYGFGQGEADGHGEQGGLLGEKGAGLAAMAALGIPVPPGFTITSEVCGHYVGQRSFPDGLEDQVLAALERVGDLTETRFGDPEHPLLVSVRTGGQGSVAGLMGAILNLGLNDDTVKGLSADLGDARFAYDCYRRFVASYAEAVMGVGREGDGTSPFAAILAAKKKERGVATAAELSPEDLKSLVTEYKIEVLREVETPFPEDPEAQLWGAIGAALRSWARPEAVAYRSTRGIPSSPGCAVNLQAMVFGNLGQESGCGVLYSRDPQTGEPGVSGRFLANAQGSELTAGDRPPGPLADLGQAMPTRYSELTALCDRLEKHFADLLEIEFTIQQGTLSLLQVRSAARSGQAMVRTAVDLVAEGLIDARTAVLRIDPGKLESLLHPTIAGPPPPVLARGLPAAPGAAVGKVVFSATEVDEAVGRGESVILVRAENTADDVRVMRSAEGLVIVRGGITSEAAIVARGLGKPCVSGCRALKVDPDRGQFMVGDTVVRRGDEITIDGSAATVSRGAAPLADGRRSEAFETLMAWADEFRRLKVRANIETALDARIAREFGAEGVGLCRTEHMFAADDRIDVIREVILSDDADGRRAALHKLAARHVADFLDVFRAMDGLPVTIRLFDQPLSELLPVGDKEIAQAARRLNVRPAKLLAAAEDLRERIPMLGHRGCRLAIRYPEIYEHQVRAIANAAVAATAEGISVRPRIMVPVVIASDELKMMRELVSRVMDEVLEAAEQTMPYQVGAMIELPRACMVADRIAEYADFFSFATNDLTQTVFGFSRDDASRFITEYLDREILDANPFITLDRDGVGALIRHAVEHGRAKKTKLKIGICGEHGGEPGSIEFCHRESFDYVSCSPYRVVIARVAAARAALRREARAK